MPGHGIGAGLAAGRSVLGNRRWRPKMGWGAVANPGTTSPKRLAVFCAMPYRPSRSFRSCCSSSTAGVETMQHRTGADSSFRKGVSTVMNLAPLEPLPRLSASDGEPPISPETQRDPPACPRCKTGVLRVRRRLVDRVISAVYPVHRYRCHSFICHWESPRPAAARPGPVSSGYRPPVRWGRARRTPRS